MRNNDNAKAKREYSQLLRMHDRVLIQLQRVRDELRAPGTKQLVRDIKNRTGREPGEALSAVVTAVEESIRALKLSESEIQTELLDEPGDVEVEGVPNLPPHLARFLAERKDLPDFSYEVLQDPVRGWVIAWKEYTMRGESRTVRGFGQFYERPYAWLDE